MSLKAEHIVHKGEKRIAVRFEYRADRVERFKKLQGAAWSVSLGVWHLPDTEEYRKMFHPVAPQEEQETKMALREDTQ